MADIDWDPQPYPDQPYQGTNTPLPLPQGGEQAPWPTGGAVPSGGGDGQHNITLNYGQEAQDYIKNLASKYGIGAGETDVAELQKRTREATVGQDLRDYMKALETQYAQRASSNVQGFHENVPGTNLPQSQYPGGWRPGMPFPNVQFPGTQFDDPYTKLLEQIAQNQLAQYQQPLDTAPYQQLMNFVQQRFKTLSESPGYTPAEQAVISTQSTEPIEALRTASQQRALERTSARGFLPSSGLQEAEARDIDRQIDQMRTVAGRDLAINAINKQNQDLQGALSLGQLQIEIPRLQFGDQQTRNNAALNIATLLQRLPAQSLAEAMSVINGTTSPASLLGEVGNITNQQNLANAQSWANVGALIANIFRQ
jgi:hypothetical protein